jgi:hypothetical protein
MADPRLKPIKCRKTLGEYAARVTWCEACGKPEGPSVKLDLHHLVKRGRSDERCNLIRLCGPPSYWHSPSCHERVEATSGSSSWIPFGVILSIKKLRDPEGWNADRLAELRLRPLPDLLEIPTALLTEFEKWRPTHSNNEGDMPW